MRARNLKPGFFKNEDLAECAPLARLLYAGLWCLSDREGRMEYRPKRIKAEILPYDECDIDDLLNQLRQRGFVLTYRTIGQEYLSIPKFVKHQNCHIKETASTIPAPDEHSACTVQAPDEHGSSPAEPLLLNPESPIPLTESSFLSETEKNVSDGNGKYPPCPQNEIVNLYHITLLELPRVKQWPENLQAILRTRWKEDPARQTLAWWEAFFSYVHESDFLTGRTKEAFVADLEWLIRPKNFTKIANGRYHGRGSLSAKPQPGIAAWLSERREHAAAG